MADLVFNIATGRLSGHVDGYHVNVFAWSGGRGGTKTAGAANELIINNPLAISLKLKKHGDHDYAGPLPVGTYRLSYNPKKAKNWIVLNPVKGNVMFDRDGFAIHGRGKRGSDGCIVPFDFQVVEKLYQLVKRGTRTILLDVVAVGDIDYFIWRTDFYRHLG